MRQTCSVVHFTTATRPGGFQDVQAGNVLSTDCHNAMPATLAYSRSRNLISLYTSCNAPEASNAYSNVNHFFLSLPVSILNAVTSRSPSVLR